MAFIINSMRAGGAERVLANLTESFPEDWEIDIILTDARDISYPYRGNVINLGIYKEKYKSSFVYFAKVLLRRIAVLKKLKKEKRYDACIGFADSANIANILSGKKYCKNISTVHLAISGAKWLPEYKYVVCPLVKLMYNRSDKVIAVSRGIERDLRINYGIKENLLQTIYNGCDLKMIDEKLDEKLEPGQEKWFSAPACPMFVTMGRLEAQKGQWHLIRAFSEIVKKYPSAKLIILGTGDKKEYLIKMAEGLNLSDNVIFGGFCRNPFNIMARCDIFVFPSLFEGFSNAIIEGMYCGLPAIAADFDTGARELLAPDTSAGYKNLNKIEYAEYGIIVPVCDGTEYRPEDKLADEEKILAKAMLELYERADLYEKYKAKAKARAGNFSQRKMADDWESMIEELVQLY